MAVDMETRMVLVAGVNQADIANGIMEVSL